MFARLSLAAAIVLLAASAACSRPPKENKPDDGDRPDQYIRVEVRGKLKTGIVAIGGETTGVTITADGVTWELKLRDEAMKQEAERLNEKVVEVHGVLHVRKGVEVPRRWIVEVARLERARPRGQPAAPGNREGVSG